MSELLKDEECLLSRFIEYTDQLLNFQSNNYDDLITLSFSTLSKSLGFKHLFFSDQEYLFELSDGKLIKLPWEDTKSLVVGTHKEPLFTYHHRDYAFWLMHPPSDEDRVFFDRITRLFQLKLEQWVRRRSDEVDKEPLLNAVPHTVETISSAGSDLLAAEKEEVRMLREWNRSLEHNVRFQSLFLSKLLQEEIGVLSTLIGLQKILENVSEHDVATRTYFFKTIYHHLKGQHHFLQLIDLSEKLRQGDLDIKVSAFDLSSVIYKSISQFLEFNYQQDIEIVVPQHIETISLEGNRYFLSQYLSTVYYFNRLLSEKTEEERATIELSVCETEKYIEISVCLLLQTIPDLMHPLIQPIEDLMGTISEETSNIYLYNYCLHQTASLLKGQFKISMDQSLNRIVSTIRLQK